MEGEQDAAHFLNPNLGEVNNTKEAAEQRTIDSKDNTRNEKVQSTVLLYFLILFI